MIQIRSVLTSHNTILELSEEQFYDRFKIVLGSALLTVLAVEPAVLELSEELATELF